MGKLDCQTNDPKTAKKRVNASFLGTLVSSVTTVYSLLTQQFWIDMTQDNSPAAITKVGERVLNIEADAISQMANCMPADFAATAQLILGLEGRVIVAGIGKSGHIGRKISATLASTGTPSDFFTRLRQATAIWAWSRKAMFASLSQTLAKLRNWAT